MKAFKMFHPSSWVPAPERWYELHLDVLSCESPIYGVYVLPPKSTGFLNCLQSKKNRSVNKTPCFIVNEVFVGHCSGEINREFQRKHGSDGYNWSNQQLPTILCEISAISYLGLTSFSFFLGGVPRNTRFLSSIDTTRQTWRQNPTVS